MSRQVNFPARAHGATASASADPLARAQKYIFDDTVMSERLPPQLVQRFQECLRTSDSTPPADQKIIAETIFEWARELGAVDFAHWFFPVRGGGGAVGGQCGAFKRDTMVDLDFGSKSANKPMKVCMPHERFFQGESDGSSFPSGGMRTTHAAAAFTTWDRSSPPFVSDTTLYVPCSFITHYGNCIDDKTPLLRSNDAVQTYALKLLQLTGLDVHARAARAYLGWEQEFFVVSAENFKKRPDLVNCGRTLIGALPPRNQQAELNYFAPVPYRVDELMRVIQEEMLKVGSAMAVRHNEVAPGQHEMSPIFSCASHSCDSNVFFMELANREAAKMGLQVLFHEKPFAGVNGSGKHCNWSVITDTGMNFFYPGKTDEGRKLFVTAIACLAHGLLKHNELVRCAVAHAGNDFRLGAQEAPPAIISLYPGALFEKHIDAVISGAPLEGFKSEKKMQSTGCAAAMAVEANVEDRNRTAPFPFCGNRFEFRAVGSSQNCAFPVMICNAIMAAGMSHLLGLIESGFSHRDAVAEMYRQSKSVIFTGNGYSAEWPVEAVERGLPNLNTTPKALAQWASEKNKQLLDDVKIFSPEETEARGEIMLENYVTSLSVEAQTMLLMLESGIIPACAKDLEKYGSFPKMAGTRPALYEQIVEETAKLKALTEASIEGLESEAEYLCNVVKPQMEAVRKLVDEAEGLMEAGLYPYPNYEEILYSHHH